MRTAVEERRGRLRFDRRVRVFLLCGRETRLGRRRNGGAGGCWTGKKGKGGRANEGGRETIFSLLRRRRRNAQFWRDGPRCTGRRHFAGVGVGPVILQLVHLLIVLDLAGAPCRVRTASSSPSSPCCSSPTPPRPSCTSTPASLSGCCPACGVIVVGVARRRVVGVVEPCACSYARAARRHVTRLLDRKDGCRWKSGREERTRGAKVELPPQVRRRFRVCGPGSVD